MADERPEVAAVRIPIPTPQEVMANVSNEQLLRVSSKTFLAAYDELTEVIRRLGDRKSDLDELFIVAKTLRELARKVDRLSQKLAPELEGQDVR